MVVTYPLNLVRTRLQVTSHLVIPLSYPLRSKVTSLVHVTFGT